jgi:hypothetical protein
MDEITAKADTSRCRQVAFDGYFKNNICMPMPGGNQADQILGNPEGRLTKDRQ